MCACDFAQSSLHEGSVICSAFASKRFSHIEASFAICETLGEGEEKKRDSVRMGSLCMHVPYMLHFQPCMRQKELGFTPFNQKNSCFPFAIRVVSKFFRYLFCACVFAYASTHVQRIMSSCLFSCSNLMRIICNRIRIMVISLRAGVRPTRRRFTSRFFYSKRLRTNVLRLHSQK